MIELFSENRDPSPELVAAQSGVSPRSVYRYFEDRETLVQAAIERHMALVAPLYEIPHLGEGPLEDRIELFATNRVRLHDEVADTARIVRARAVRHRAIDARIADVRALLADQVEQHFADGVEAVSGSHAPGQWRGGHRRADSVRCFGLLGVVTAL
jgi:AcrR family transcriptional regulator